MLTFGDDGEKFGTWPDTKAHVYEKGWLRSFFDALTGNADWLHTVTVSEAMRCTPPRGQSLRPRLQLPRDDRMVVAGRSTGNL